MLSAQVERALRHHKGPVRLLGDRRGGGAVAVYLFAGQAGLPMLGVHAAGRFRGSGGAVLRLAEVWRLSRHLDDLLRQAGFKPPPQGGDDGRA
ncbi:hypothetical protein GCM10022225_41520 [Plantactinospora mayteni]|uniref:Uncharacterized protein n=1 Tax=Plantactinospora mayteni TaxID=566021 RepID=A0ABQ4EU47_9ACTN|nr:hypothetical protein Pma05_47490 [Plantactinospora mayteni]